MWRVSLKIDLGSIKWERHFYTDNPEEADHFIRGRWAHFVSVSFEEVKPNYSNEILEEFTNVLNIASNHFMEHLKKCSEQWTWVKPEELDNKND